MPRHTMKKRGAKSGKHGKTVSKGGTGTRKRGARTRKRGRGRGHGYVSGGGLFNRAVDNVSSVANSVANKVNQNNPGPKLDDNIFPLKTKGDNTSLQRLVKTIAYRVGFTPEDVKKIINNKGFTYKNLFELKQLKCRGSQDIAENNDIIFERDVSSHIRLLKAIAYRLGLHLKQIRLLGSTRNLYNYELDSLGQLLGNCNEFEDTEKMKYIENFKDNYPDSDERMVAIKYRQHSQPTSDTSSKVEDGPGQDAEV